MKRFILTTLQALVTIALLYWIFRDEDKRALMWETLQDANWWWFIPGLAALGIMTILQTLRWLWLLRVQGVSPSFRRTYGINLIGMFFNLFLPGGTGGDLIKMYLVSREAPGKRAASVLSVFMDRVVGLLALIAIAGIVSLFAFNELWAESSLRGLIITLGCIVGGAIGFMLFVFVIEKFHLAKKLPSWLPLRHAFLEVAASFSTYARTGGALWAAFLISLPTHILIFFSFFCAARALSAELTFLQLFTVLPIILTIAALPISVAGLGGREQLFKVTLGALYAVPGGVAVLVGFTGFMLAVVWGAVGGLVYIVYRPSQKDGKSIHEMEKEMEQVEHRIEEEMS
jgi:uncharacterized protein (TIRG00374 family)